MGTESLRTYNKIEPSSFSTKDRVIQIIGFSALLLWLVVYMAQAINFSQYEDGYLLNDGSLIKALLVLAAFSFTMSILLGMWTYYKIKRVYSKDSSNWAIKLVKWFTFGLLVFMLSILYILVPESNRFFDTYLIVLAYAGKHIMRKISKNPE